MRIAIPREPDSEPRVAATPETVKKMKSLGADVAVEAGAGTRSGILDSDYEAAGASLHGSAADAVRDADVVLKVRRPSAEEVAQYKRGAIVGRVVEPGQPRRLSRGDRRGRGIRPRAADDDDRGGHGAGGQGVHNGR